VRGDRPRQVYAGTDELAGDHDVGERRGRWHLARATAKPGPLPAAPAAQLANRQDDPGPDQGAPRPNLSSTCGSSRCALPHEGAPAACLSPVVPARVVPSPLAALRLLRRQRGLCPRQPAPSTAPGEHPVRPVTLTWGVGPADSTNDAEPQRFFFTYPRGSPKAGRARSAMPS